MIPRTARTRRGIAFSRMTGPRRGVALITALWLVVAIAAVALEFSLDAHERRVLGVDTAERGAERAAAAGALAEVHARLDYALRVAPTNARAAGLRASDPWLDVDSLYSGRLDGPLDAIAPWPGRAETIVLKNPFR